MSMNRRDFLKGTAWMSAAAMAAGCANALKFCGNGGMMNGFAVAPLKKVRVGVVGLGSRGAGAVHRISMIPGVEVTALCEIRKPRVEGELKWLKENGKPAPKVFWDSEDSWKRMCEWDGIDSKITNDPRVASKAAPRGSFVIYFSSPPVLSLLF